MAQELNTTSDELPQLDQEELQQQAEEQARLAEEQRQSILRDLAAAVEAKFEDRRRKRAAKELQWTECTSLYYGTSTSYGRGGTSSDRPFDSGTTKQRPDFNIVRTKCDIALAQLVSMQFAGGDKNWDLFPEPGESSEACMAMEETIANQLRLTAFGRESRKAMMYRVMLGVGILKGPVNTAKTYSKYGKDEITGEWVSAVASNKHPSYVCVNPWYAFPDPNTSDPCALEDFIELHPLTKTDLAKYAKHPGFNAEAISELLREDASSGSLNTYEQSARGGSSGTQGLTGKYMVLEYHGPVTSDQLASAGVIPAYDSVDGVTYYAEVWVCQGHVLRVELQNIESFEIPYHLCPYKDDPTSVLGIGLPMLVRDQQRVITQAWHMILDNSSASSGPQVVIQKGLIEPADGDWELRPRKVWHLTDLSARVGDAFQYFLTPNVTEDLMTVLNTAKAFSEEESGVPLIMAGLQSPQVATDSATGLGIMQQASTTLLDLLNETWDDLINERAIQRMYQWNMQYNPDSAIKGNYKLDVRSSSDLRNKQLYVRDMEKLGLEAVQNQEMAKHVDLGELTRARLSMMHLPSTKIVRGAEQVAEYVEQAAANQPPSPEVLKYNVETERLKIEKDQLTLEADKLEFEQTQMQQREQWENEERQANTYARVTEAEALVLKSQNDKDIAMLQLAQKDQHFAAKVQADMEIMRQRNETTAFLEGLKATQKRRDQLLVAEELSIKRQTGTGI